MTKLTLIKQVKEIEKDFAKCGFIYTPLSRKKIASLLLRGFSYCEIYRFGCDAYCQS